jgi:hypothetical protein
VTWSCPLHPIAVDLSGCKTRFLCVLRFMLNKQMDGLQLLSSSSSGAMCRSLLPFDAGITSGSFPMDMTKAAVRLTVRQ